jgi:hypothetical protein
VLITGLITTATDTLTVRKQPDPTGGRPTIWPRAIPDARPFQVTGVAYVTISGFILKNNIYEQNNVGNWTRWLSNSDNTSVAHNDLIENQAPAEIYLESTSASFVPINANRIKPTSHKRFCRNGPSSFTHEHGRTEPLYA